MVNPTSAKNWISPQPPPAGAAGYFIRYRWLVLVLAAHALGMSLLNRVISPHPDYIDHWIQSRYLSLGYYEHPPMAPWIIRGFTTLLGSSETALESAALIMNLAILALAAALAARLFGALAALFTLLFYESTLYFSLGSDMLQIDQPLMLAWVGGLWVYAAWRKSGRDSLLVGMGLVAGLGALSKYTMILFYLGLGVYFILCRPLRSQWRNPWQYLGGLAAMAAVSPVIYWNATHDWVSFRFQLAKGQSAAAIPPGKHLLEFTLGYLLLFSLVLALWVLVVAAGRLRREKLGDNPRSWLLVMGLTPLVLFTLAMIQGPFPDPKWANLTFLTLFILLGDHAARMWRVGRTRLVGGMLALAFALQLGLGGVLALHARHPFLPVKPSLDPARQILGWEETVRAAEQVLAAKQIPPPRYVASFFYPLAAQFALHMTHQPLTHSFERDPRNLWSPPQNLTPDNTLLVCEEECGDLKYLARVKLGVEIIRVGEAETGQGAAHHHIQLYRISPRGK
ncbi:MAG: glycosyltransferase family 39 protein, partial [Deltaproteobacteria bacterium]|nr:glycosyltransferase family 39 protein [Deltaproteobacteria bacterium]